MSTNTIIKLENVIKVFDDREIISYKGLTAKVETAEI